MVIKAGGIQCACEVRDWNLFTRRPRLWVETKDVVDTRVHTGYKQCHTIKIEVVLYRYKLRIESWMLIYVNLAEYVSGGGDGIRESETPDHAISALGQAYKLGVASIRCSQPNTWYEYLVWTGAAIPAKGFIYPLPIS